MSENTNRKSEIEKIASRITTVAEGLGPLQIMEVCGTHTVALLRTGVKSMLPPNVRLISGPGCPVCVTSQGYLDAACEIATRPNVTICTYGDMVRVPGSTGSLEQHRARGAKVNVVYSPRDALNSARENPTQQFVFLAVGFETTTPATAATVLEAEADGIENFHVLCAHKLVVPAMNALLSGGEVPVDGFLCPGHVSVIIGSDAYKQIATDYHKPCVVASFEPVGMLNAILMILEQIAAGDARVQNAYEGVVTPEGNTQAWGIIEKVFEPGTATWRAMGDIPDSGLNLREEFARFDALKFFDVEMGPDVCPPGCRCGEVIQGKVIPDQCPLFGTVCTPIDAIGPCMVSSEGTCAAWYKYERRRGEKSEN